MKAQLKLRTLINTTCLGTAMLFGASGVFAQSSWDENRAELRKQEEKREATGMFSGAAAGAVVGGPAGAVLGAIVGVYIGDSINNEKGREQAQASLEDMEQQYLALLEEKEAMQTAMQELRAARLQQVSYSQDRNNPEQYTNAELVLHFRTNSDRIEAHYGKSLDDFADLARRNPEAIIQITGHADQRGQSQSNLALSQDRVRAVKEALETRELNDVTIQSIAYGESRTVASDPHPESQFYDRRVVIKIRPRNGEYLSRNDD